MRAHATFKYNFWAGTRWRQEVASVSNKQIQISLPPPLFGRCPPRLVIFFKHEPDGMVPYANYACHSPINHSADPPEPELSLTYLFFRLK